jgi:hypothetical protein
MCGVERALQMYLFPSLPVFATCFVNKREWVVYLLSGLARSIGPWNIYFVESMVVRN